MFGGLFANALYGIHQGQNLARGLSPRLWGRAVHSALAPDGFGGGYFVGDDFRGFGIGTAVATNVGYYISEAGTYYSFEDTGGAIAQLATERTGAVRLSVDADDNQETWLQYGNATSVSGVISDTAGDDKLLIFEARFRCSDVVGNRFIGLTEEGFAANDGLSDVGVLAAAKDYIGFYTAEGAPTTLKFGWQKASQTPVALATAATIAASTWYKVGFVYDPLAPPAKRIKYYVDNVEGATYGTATQIAAATFPDAEELQPIFGVKNVTDIMLQDIDWWGMFQAD